jgi:hypothetical protein
MLDAPPIQIDVPALVRHDLAAAKRRTRVPILLPSTAPANPDAPAVSGSGYGRRTHWAFEFAYDPNCGGATACFLGEVTGQRGATPAFRKRVTLRGGRTGYYKPLSCGASCSPPEIQWVERKVLYSIQWNETSSGGSRRTMISLANSAIAAGPR